MQTKIQSMIETITNIGIGYFVALGSQIIIFPIFGLKASILDNLGIGACFTVISIIRSYCVRRMFNYIHERQRV